MFAKKLILMFNLSKKEHLESLISPLRKYKYCFRIREKLILSDSYVLLTVGNKQDFLELKLIRKWTRIFGKYHIRLLSSNIILLDHLDLANQYAEKNTGRFNFLKRKFHKNLKLASSAARKENMEVLSSTARTEKLNETVLNIWTNPLYQEELSVFDFVRPAIGIEMTDTGMHPSFGIVLGGERGGGVIMFDPFEGDLEMGAWQRVGEIGLYDVFSEFDVYDSIGNLFDTDD